MSSSSSTSSPFHAGEIAIQEKMDVRRVEDLGRRVIRSFMPEQHRAFFAALPFLVAGARDAAGQTWATLLEGDSGFVDTPNETTLQINAVPSAGDPLEGALRAGTDLGLIGIELATRRRNRVNGRVTAHTDSGIQFEVGQSFGNCPQHIHARGYTRLDRATPQPALRSTDLSKAQRDWIATSDTFFIASGHSDTENQARSGMDASHRGGTPGFVEVLSAQRLQFPDYPGNNYYNTLGNIHQDSRTGLLFIDFANGGLLHLTGRATISDDPELVQRFPGALQVVTFDIDAVVERPEALRLRWDAEGDAIRELRVLDKKVESEDTVSLMLAARDGGQLPMFKPGQYLPLEITIPGAPQKIRRSYSLTIPPGENRYQITVKREDRGLVSRFLHDALQPGDFISGFRPNGDFDLPAHRAPMVLISAGIGITPMISLLRAGLNEDPNRPIWFLHGARNRAHHPFKDLIQTLKRNHAALTVFTCYSQPDPKDLRHTEFDTTGRLTPDHMSEFHFPDDAHFFLCGPGVFTAEWEEALIAHGTPVDNIHLESFGS